MAIKQAWIGLLEETDPDLVKIEVDFYWVMHAGVISPKALIEKPQEGFRSGILRTWIKLPETIRSLEMGL